jgi:hypothetical protein
MICIELMSILRGTKASLNTYDEVLTWHLHACGELRRHETLGNWPHYISRKKLLSILTKRYAMGFPLTSTVKNVTLPSSGARVQIAVKSVHAAFQSLLSDPRIKDTDYLFFEDDPFCPPPDDLNYYGDINTGSDEHQEEDEEEEDNVRSADEDEEEDDDEERGRTPSQKNKKRRNNKKTKRKNNKKRRKM